MAVGRMAGGAPAVTTPTMAASSGAQGRMANFNVNNPGVGRMTDATQEAAIPTNPLSFLGGFIKNIGAGAVDIVKGLGALLIQAPAHDIVQLGANLYPGEQQIENEPSALATMARVALPGAAFPGPDLGGKYGAIASDIAHRYGGASNIARGFYENPLAYVMDALVLADGVGAVAKAGRGGALLGKLPTLVSDETAAKILGPALRWSPEGVASVARYGERPFASLSRAPGKFEDALKLSQNPIVRYTQNKLYNAISLSPEQARALGLAETLRGEQVISDAARYEPLREGLTATQQTALPTRILRPKVGEFLSQHENSRILSKFRVDMRDLATEAVDELKPLMPPNTADGSRAIDYERVTRIDIGDQNPSVQMPLDNIDYVPDNFEARDFHAIPNGEDVRFDPAVNKYIGENYTYRRSLVGDRKSGRQQSIIGHETPYVKVGGADPTGATAGTNNFAIEVASLDDAGRVAEKVLNDTGYNVDKFVHNTLADIDNPYHMLAFWGKNKEGNWLHLSVGEPDLIYAQKAAAGTYARIAQWTKEVETVTKELTKVPDSGSPRFAQLAARKVHLTEELQAAREYLREEVFAHSRANYWAKKGAEVDSEAMVALATRPWRAKHLTERWFQEAPGEASYVRMMNEKFVPQRVLMAKRIAAEYSVDMQKILTQGQANIPKVGKITADHYTYLQLDKYLTSKGFPTNIVEDILRQNPWLDAAGRRNPITAADNLMKRINDRMWDLWIKEGGAGKSQWQEFSWRTMQAAYKDPTNPGMVPSYYPLLPKPPSAHAMREGTSVRLTEKQPGMFTEERTGAIFNEGKAELDPTKALPRAVRIIYMHDSVNSYIRSMTDKFARNASVEQRAAALAGDSRYAGEVFYNPKSIDMTLRKRGDLAAKTVLATPDEGSVLDAVLSEVRNWTDEVFKEGVNTLDGELKAIPRHIADEISREVKTQFGNNVKLFWDTPLKVWKASVLSLSPRWIVNNMFGNLIFVGLENPGALRHVLSQLDRRNRAIAEGLLGYDPIRVTESGFYHEMQDVASAITDEVRLSPKVAKTRGILLGDKEVGGRLGALNAPARGIRSWSRGVRSMNSYIEEAFRRGVLLDELARRNVLRTGKELQATAKLLEDGADNGWTTRMINESIERVDRVMGNFMRYSPVEQGVVRRFFFPFYGFYRHMLNVLIKLPIEHPLKASLFQKMQQVNEIMEADMPEYLKGTAAVHLGDLFGGDSYIRLKNMNPLSSITEDYGLVNTLSPTLKLIIERGLGINTFTGEPFDPQDLGQNDIIQTHDGQFWKIVRAGDGSVIDVIRTGRPLPGLVQHIGSQFGVSAAIPQFNLYNRSYLQQVTSWAGLPITRPKTGTAEAVAYDQEVHDEALAQAVGGSGFGDMGSFGSFGSF